MTDGQNPMFSLVLILMEPRVNSVVDFLPFHEFVRLPDPELCYGCSQ